jgi:hypothetical protein
VFDYIEKQKKKWTITGANEAARLWRQLADIEEKGVQGDLVISLRTISLTNTEEVVNLYCKRVGKHLIAHAQNPNDQNEIIVPLIFSKSDINGQNDALRLLRKVVPY